MHTMWALRGIKEKYYNLPEDFRFAIEDNSIMELNEQMHENSKIRKRGNKQVLLGPW